MSSSSLREGLVTTIAFGGNGILRDQGQVIFVPFTAPEDQVVVQIIRQKRRYAEGRLVKILSPSPLRTTPVCPYFGRCGGCQFQHLSATAQQAIKRQFLQEAFHSLFKRHSLDLAIPEIIAAEESWSYRKHIRLKIQRDSSGTFQIGYLDYDYHFIAIQQCAIFHQNGDPILTQLTQFLQGPAWHAIKSGEVKIFHIGERYLFVFYLNHLPDTLDSISLPHASWQGIILSASEKPAFIIGDTRCEWFLPPFHLSVVFSPFGFIQNHEAQSLKLYRFILDQIPSTVHRALDLYCGIGITSLLIGQQGIETVGIESHPETIEKAKENASRNQIKNVVFQCGDAEKITPSLLQETSYDLILMNPPRTGLSPALTATIGRSHVPHLIYVSCMPSTLVRDLDLFLQQGYVIKTIQGFDLFPQTTHIETVVILSRNTELHIESNR